MNQVTLVTLVYFSQLDENSITYKQRIEARVHWVNIRLFPTAGYLFTGQRILSQLLCVKYEQAITQAGVGYARGIFSNLLDNELSVNCESSINNLAD